VLHRSLSCALLVAALAAPLSLAGQESREPVGCYRFPGPGGFFSWVTYEPWSFTLSEHTSELVELTAARREGRNGFQLRSPGMRDSTARRQIAGSSWRRTAPDSVELIWGDGESGVMLQLQMRSDSLIGTFTTFTDEYMEGADDVKPITLLRVSCPSARPGGDGN
jgi:hypothetical protein